jgi:hypothetical protein
MLIDSAKFQTHALSSSVSAAVIFLVADGVPWICQIRGAPF